jgi:CRISPR-associated exonuclease Cas4
MDLDFHDVLLTPSDVLEHMFCGRFTYFERHLALPEFQERREKVLRGRALHAVREATNRSYLRKRLGVAEKQIDMSLVSPRHHLRGRIDEVLFFSDGTAGPLDYKFAKDPGRVHATLRLQSAIYALLIREHFGLPVHRGYLVYTRSQNRVVGITYDADDFLRIGRVVQQILHVVQLGTLPRRAAPGHCVDCCYRFICV